MTFASPQFVEAISSNGRRLRVTFVWTRDRFAHNIALIDGTRHVPLLASADCCDTPSDWPLSPPMQQLSVEAIDNHSPTAFLVGMAGRSHWSAVMQPVANQLAIDFDMAVRVAVLPPFAGSGYRTMVDANLHGSQSAELKIDDLRCEIIADIETHTSIEKTVDGVSLPCRQTPSRFPATLRWKYRIRAGE